MDFGLAWLRRRQRSLARGVLALFCAAWLQAAIVPCVMAHGDAALASVAAPGHDGGDGHGAHVSHDHGAVTSGHANGEASQPCLYCPADESGGHSCDGHGGCAYPHDPQVDARAGAIFAAMPLSFVAAAPPVERGAQHVESSAVDAVPRVRLSVSYCRFIE